MESNGTEFTGKRMKLVMEEQGKDTGISNVLENEKSEMSIRGSEEMESNIACLLEKIESFTQLVSELLESGKTAFKDLSNEFEERIIARLKNCGCLIHQMRKPVLFYAMLEIYFRMVTSSFEGNFKHNYFLPALLLEIRFEPLFVNGFHFQRS